jgi:hypothetical protein
VRRSTLLLRRFIHLLAATLSPWPLLEEVLSQVAASHGEPAEMEKAVSGRGGACTRVPCPFVDDACRRRSGRRHCAHDRAGVCAHGVPAATD